MKYFLDTEFIDNGKTLELISIGIVAEDGRELYLQSCEFNPNAANSWVIEHVYSSMIPCPHVTRPCETGYIRVENAILKHRYGPLLVEDFPANGCCWRMRYQIRDEIQTFLDPSRYGNPELYGWCSGYDFVVFCQIFGTMLNLPQGYPHYIRDLQQLLDEQGVSDDELPSQIGDTHNALSDARHIQKLWNLLTKD